MTGQRVDTLTLEELEGYPGNDRPGRSGEKMRYFCPIHGGDKQRSLELRPNGGWKCYACGAWGYIKEINREHWQPERRTARVDRFYGGKFGRKSGGGILTPSRPLKARRNENRGQSGGVDKPSDHEPATPDLTEKMARFRETLTPESLAARYLKWRGISLETAKRFGLGYAEYGEWPHYKDGRPVRQWKHGRLVAPHTDPAGRIINLYGRAIGGHDVPKKDKHTHLPGERGVFNAAAMAEETVFIVEGLFDALALAEAGYTNVCAIFGVNGLRPQWLKARTVIFGLDQDTAGKGWQRMAAHLRLMGKRVLWIGPEVYGGEKDLAAAWAKYRALPIGSIPEPEPVGPGSDPEESEVEPPGHWADRETVTRLFDEAVAILTEVSQAGEEAAMTLEESAATLADKGEKPEEKPAPVIDPKADECDEKARENGWFILQSGGAYEKQLTRWHSVFLFREADGWEAIRATWRPGDSVAAKETAFFTGPFDRAMEEANKYINWFQRKNKRDG